MGAGINIPRGEELGILSYDRGLAVQGSEVDVGQRHSVDQDAPGLRDDTAVHPGRRKRGREWSRQRYQRPRVRKLRFPMYSIPVGDRERSDATVVR